MKLLKERINYPSTNNGMFFFSYIWLQFYYVYQIKKHIIQNITNISFYSIMLSKLNSNILYLILFTDSNLSIIYSQLRIIKFLRIRKALYKFSLYLRTATLIINYFTDISFRKEIYRFLVF